MSGRPSPLIFDDKKGGIFINTAEEERLFIHSPLSALSTGDQNPHLFPLGEAQ